MNISDLMEKTRHGTDDFPVAYYDSVRPVAHQWHREDEFLYMVSGCAVYTINGRKIELKAGDCVFCAGRGLHSLIAEKNQPFRFKAVVCSRKYLFGAKDKCSEYFNKELKIFYNKNIPAEAEITERVKEICRLLEQRSYGYELDVKGKLIGLYSVIVANKLFEKDNIQRLTPNNNLLSAITHIHNNFSDKLYAHELASLTGYSVPYFEKFFKEQVGMTPSEYIMMYRLNTAGDLLRETNKSITEIAHACGFNNVSFFIREFKKDYSVTPNKYRKTKIADNTAYAHIIRR